MRQSLNETDSLSEAASLSNTRRTQVIQTELK